MNKSPCDIDRTKRDQWELCLFFVCLKKIITLNITMGSHTLFKKRKNMVHTRKTATKLHAFLSFFKRRMIDKKST